MIIRQAVADDLPTMVQITHDARSFASSPDPYLWDVTDSEMHARLSRLLAGEQGIAFVVEVENQIAGFAACHYDEMDPKNPDKAAIIDILAVAQPFRNQGLGTQLLRELMITLPSLGISQIDTNVLGGNESAMRFWRRAGFTETAVKMTLRLPNSPE